MLAHQPLLSLRWLLSPLRLCISWPEAAEVRGSLAGCPLGMRSFLVLVMLALKSELRPSVVNVCLSGFCVVDLQVSLAANEFF